MTESAIMHRRSHPSFAVVIALAAALLQAYWPLLAAAGPAQRTMPLAQLCSMSGARYAPADDAPPTPAVPLQLPHCAYCAFNPGNSSLASAAPALIPGGVRFAAIPVPLFFVPLPRQRASIHDGYPRPPPGLA